MPATTRKIATFNVNGITSRLPHLLEWLQREQPDIVGLQELKATQDAFPEQAIRDAGYGVIWQGEKSWNGVALLARGTDPVEIRRGCHGTLAIRRAVISKRQFTGSWWPACIYPTAIRSPGRSSTTSWHGFNA